MRHRKWCLASSGVGRLNDVIRHPSGLTSPITCLIVPSFPEVSIPWRTSRMERAFSAHSRSWRAARRSPSVATEASAFFLSRAPGWLSGL